MAFGLFRKRQPEQVVPGGVPDAPAATAPDIPATADHDSAREILELMDQLPTGYRTVFNLYVLEGYKHHEIADALGISINTSKSQLILAKEKLRNLLKTKGF